MSGCPFHMRFSPRSGTHYWQLASFKDKHTCFRTARNRLAKTEWLAKNFVSILSHSPYIKVKGLIAEARNRWGLKLTHDHAYRAKRRAMEKLQGASTEQYLNLRNYAEELRRSNPNSTVIIKCDSGPNGPIFERIYVCLEACKAAFAWTCRPLIGLDACFLKGEFGGQLMAAVGKDGNNQMFPIAYAVVEAETKDSWAWFINLLLEDLNQINPKPYAFISDQQKGLVPAIVDYGHQIEHRLCVKHLYANWKKKYPGDDMKKAFWSCARATTIPQFQRSMEALKNLNESGWKDMMELPPAAWSRSHYKLDTQCDLQVNNMCEAFNSVILDHRDKPIISLLEGLKYYLTNRIVQQKTLIQRYNGDICPRVQMALEKNKQDADGWSPFWHGDDEHRAIFTVDNGTEQYGVNLLQHTCACRKWDLTGIPCPHAICCMWSNNLPPENYVAQFYRKSTFLATYSYLIMPTNGPMLWPLTESEPIHPPRIRRAPGRPKKVRNKSNDEPRDPNRLPRLLPTVKCQKCGVLGHNRRSCKGKTKADRVIPVGGNKRVKRTITEPEEASTSQPSQATQPSGGRGRARGNRRARGRARGRESQASQATQASQASKATQPSQATQPS